MAFAQARTIRFVAETGKLRELPAVHEVLASLPAAAARYPRALVVAEIRRAIEDARSEILAGQDGGPPVAARVERALDAVARPSLRRVINATGVVVHTNLGRAPLATFTRSRAIRNLEYDLPAGKRGQRDVHSGPLLRRLLDAPAIAVNNNAAALLLALNELAAGGEVVVSRGELIEIGDGFRIPEIMARSGAALREVGTTNRTRIDDYRAAINERTRLLLRVHPSNFRISRLHRAAGAARAGGAGPRARPAGLRGPGQRMRRGPAAFRHRRTAGRRQPRGRRGPGFLQRR